MLLQLSTRLLSALLLCSAFPAETNHGYPPLPLLFAEGTHYQVGHQIGLFSGEQIRAVMNNNTFFNSEMLPYNRTTEGTSWYNSFLTTAQATFPQYVKELQGMADGASLPFSKVFLWNLLSEWELLLRGKGQEGLPAPSCSDLYLNSGGNTVLMGHNEDNDPVDMYTSFMLHARITDIDPASMMNTTDEFLAFCYAGSLCGKAFGVNFIKRTVTTVNALFPKDVVTNSIGRNFINRATLSLDMGGIEHLLNTVPCASGFSLNAGSLGAGEGGVANFEVGPSGGVSVDRITGYGYHFNMYLHSKVSQYDDPSSEHRLARVQSLPRPDDATGLIKILGDTGDKQYPIFRTATPPDHTSTIATVLFDLSEDVMYVYRGNPAEVEPQMVIPLPSPPHPPMKLPIVTS